MVNEDLIKVLLILLYLFLIGVAIYELNCNKQTPPSKVYNPKTGQKWNSVEDYKYSKGPYQGPVPEGYDLEHFRRTGETIRLNDGN